MGKTEAQEFYNPIGGETNGYVTPADAKDAIGLMYDELSPIDSPTFTGTPAAPTATSGTNTTQLSTTAFVMAAIGGVDVEVTHPNTDDVLVTVGGQTVHYDSGVRAVTGGTIRRSGNVVTRSSQSVTPTTGFSDSESTASLTYLTRDSVPSSLPGTLVIAAPA